MKVPFTARNGDCFIELETLQGGAGDSKDPN